MENIESSPEALKLSVEKVIDLVRTSRNNIIRDFLIDFNLKNRFTQLYNKELSLVKMEFLKRDLRDLLIAPVDLIHYATVIKQIRETNITTVETVDQSLATQEIESIFKKYNF